MKKFKWYTLLEVVLSILIFSSLIGTTLSIYMNIKLADSNVAGKRIILTEASDLFDKIHEAAIDYTIDYEEYFNRVWLWYWIWNTWFTSYGNSWSRYYCANQAQPSKQRTKNGRTYYSRKWNTLWCLSGWYQKYWEYSFQHRNLLKPDDLNNIKNSGANVFDWPAAISPNTWLNYLYLIWNDSTERYYFRWITDGSWVWKIQSLRLRWFDAWELHNFNSWWAFDWFIDTRACDVSQWYTCSWAETEPWYKLPIDSDDWWIDVTTEKVNVLDFKVDLYPVKDPYLAKNSNQIIDPHIKISATLAIAWNEEEDQLTLSTTLSLKNTYTHFPTK